MQNQLHPAYIIYLIRLNSPHQIFTELFAFQVTKKPLDKVLSGFWCLLCHVSVEYFWGSIKILKVLLLYLLFVSTLCDRIEKKCNVRTRLNKCHWWLYTDISMHFRGYVTLIFGLTLQPLCLDLIRAVMTYNLATDEARRRFHLRFIFSLN